MVTNEIKDFEKYVHDLRTKWNKFYTEKEQVMKDKLQIDKKIAKLISQVKKTKQKRDDINRTIQVLKKEREEKNKQTARFFGDLKKNQKDGHSQRLPSPESIKKQIQGVTVKIETQVLSLKNENLLMKEIKVLKKELKESEAQQEKVKTVTAEKGTIGDIKKAAQDVHEKIQTIAQQSEEYHQIVIRVSKEIDELKVQKEKLHTLFKEKKEAFKIVEEELHKILETSPEIKQKMHAQKVKKEEHKQKKQDKRYLRKEQVAEKRLKEVERIEEKLKTKKKITTEDLLILSAKEDIEKEIKEGKKRKN